MLIELALLTHHLSEHAELKLRVSLARVELHLASHNALIVHLVECGHEVDALRKRKMAENLVRKLIAGFFLRLA